eukprot:gnl/Spiro4/13262_TR7041_c0_g1_i1.p1 gnl/Spiro4/13262_TR7041_c0_g1~~gnl/Spiro4/13262_TR7041_c0_g1_i1.p1  ORF type:complete len:469 (-),score=83.83 gnl/Spiro4/13262_TR7041_c0_g1_i1:53-1459(-)
MEVPLVLLHSSSRHCGEPLSGTPPSERPALIRKKLLFLTQLVNWDSPHMDVQVKETQAAIVAELRDHFTQSPAALNDSNADLVVRAFCANVLRTTQKLAVDSEVVDPPTPATSESFLGDLYELFICFLTSREVEPRVAKNYYDPVVVSKLVRMMTDETCTPNERSFLKTILLRTYGKFLGLRQPLRHALENVLLDHAVAQEAGGCSGVAELLEICSNIFNSVGIPIKDEHISFLKHCLIPLHKNSFLQDFHTPLVYCISQLVSKEPILATPVISSLLKIWPVSNTSKELLFLVELEDYLEFLRADDFVLIRKQLCRRLSKGISSSHTQISGRFLGLWSNTIIAAMLVDNRSYVLPKIFRALRLNSESHWNKSIADKTYSVLKQYMELDPDLFELCSQRLASDRAGEASKEQHSHDAWKKVEQMAQLQKSRSDEAKLSSEAEQRPLRPIPRLSAPLVPSKEICVADPLD